MERAIGELFAELLQTHFEQFDLLLTARGYQPEKFRLEGSATAAELAGRLLEGRPRGTRLLIYAFGQGALHTFVLDRAGVQSHRAVTIDEESLVRAMDEVRYAILATAGTKRARDLMPWIGPTGHSLNEMRARGTELLFDEATLAAASKAEHLIVIPTLNIGVVPFAALEPQGLGEPLIERMTITIAPSAVDLVRPPRPRSPSSPPLVVGDPEGAQLPGALDEARYVADRLGVPALTGPAASKDEVMKRMPAAKLLYFATHGSSDAADPLEKGVLYLAGKDALSAREIQGLELSAELAVLSACRTGLGAAHQGGMIGLARAFILAGVPEVIMSLWNVDDATTRVLMGYFLDEREHLPTHEALRLAMRRLRKERPEPADWAPFVMLGGPSALRPEASASRGSLGAPNT